jgi:tetratricopeptide (TPR) repeat protein
MGRSPPTSLQRQHHRPPGLRRLARGIPTKLADEPYPKAYALLASLMAHAYDTLDQIAEALAASGLDPAAQSIASGYACYVGAQYALALPAWQKELAANPSDVRAQILRSACLYRLNRLDEAMKDAPRLLMPARKARIRLQLFVFGEMLRVRAANSHKDGHAALAEKLERTSPLINSDPRVGDTEPRRGAGRATAAVFFS